MEAWQSCKSGHREDTAVNKRQQNKSNNSNTAKGNKWVRDENYCITVTKTFLRMPRRNSRRVNPIKGNATQRGATRCTQAFFVTAVTQVILGSRGLLSRLSPMNHESHLSYVCMY
jgi:hypothetical protein